MPRGLKRYYGQGDLHFVTFSCYRRLRLLGARRARTAFVKELGRAREKYGFQLLGYVVIPEHVHLLISEPRKGTPSTVLQMLKQRMARNVRRRKKIVGNGQLAFGFTREEAEPRAFWQARFYDFNVYSEGKRKEKLNYMHANPEIRGLVKHPKDWLWSSWSFLLSGRGVVGDGCGMKSSALGAEKPKTHPYKPRVGHPPLDDGRSGEQVVALDRCT